MSGFYSKMLINIRNLYFNNSDDMKTILHGIFLDAADVFLNGYTPSYCEENELIPTAQKFVEKFGSTKACETGVTKEAVASAMCNPAALVALMHEMIRTLDKFHLAMLLNHICADSKNCPSSTTGWCEWLGNNWNSMT